MIEARCALNTFLLLSSFFLSEATLTCARMLSEKEEGADERVK